MTPVSSLSFAPSPIRERCWVAELPDRRYTIYESLSGFVVSFHYICVHDPGQTPAPERLRHFFSSFDEAALSCGEHYRVTTT